MTGAQNKTKGRKTARKAGATGKGALFGMTPRTMKTLGAITLAAATLTSAAAYVWRRMRKDTGEHPDPAAFAHGEIEPANFNQIRSAGPAAMRDTPGDDWDKVDQAADESFPASDPPSF